MSGLNVLLLVMAFAGFLPLGIILYKRWLVKKMLTGGIATPARVYKITRTYKPSIDLVYYAYVDPRSGKQYSGHLTTKPGLYQNGDILEIYFLPDNPSRSTIKGAWASMAFVVFGIALALFVLFAVYKIKEGVNSGDL